MFGAMTMPLFGRMHFGLYLLSARVLCESDGWSTIFFQDVAVGSSVFRSTYTQTMSETDKYFGCLNVLSRHDVTQQTELGVLLRETDEMPRAIMANEKTSLSVILNKYDPIRLMVNIEKLNIRFQLMALTEAYLIL